ncbi:MAG TPA: hypothetical protein VKY19_22140 [Ktedonosporobacter sp.]|jgi:hypothetical protein|nr:hypothetical protein [Ktedonosporobacter sp.]
MRKWVYYALIVLGGVLQLCLLGCSSSQSSPVQTKATPLSRKPLTSATSNKPLTAVDWANFTYFSSCYQNTQPFHTKNGQAVNGYVHFYVYTPKYGDLTRDGELEAVVPYQCTAADATGVRVFVYTGDAAHVRLIGDLPLPDASGAIDNVTRITIRDETLLLEGDGYSPGTPRCCPDLFVKTSYQWNGKTFVVTQNTVIKRPSV